MTPRPYFEREGVVLYHGDCRDLLPAIGAVDAVVTDPPYGDTSLEWDVPVERWLELLASSQLWCFGSMRFFMDHAETFRRASWRYAQDIVWEKHNGSGFAADRFKRVHEHALHFYRGRWNELYRDVPRTHDATARQVRRKTRPTHTGDIGRGHHVSVDGGPRLARSVIEVRSCHGDAIVPTQKPVALLELLVQFSVPPGGVVLDCFAGSCSTLEAARRLGRRAIGIEIDERTCELAAAQLASGVLAFPEATS